MMLIDTAFSEAQTAAILQWAALLPSAWTDRVRAWEYDRTLRVPAQAFPSGRIVLGPQGAAARQIRGKVVHEIVHLADLSDDGGWGRLARHFTRSQLQQWSYVGPGRWDGLRDEQEGVAVIFEWLFTVPWALKRRDPSAWATACSLIGQEGGALPAEATAPVRTFPYGPDDFAWWGEILLADLIKQTGWESATVTRQGGAPVYMDSRTARTGRLGRLLALHRAPVWRFRMRAGDSVTRRAP